MRAVVSTPARSPTRTPARLFLLRQALPPRPSADPSAWSPIHVVRLLPSRPGIRQKPNGRQATRGVIGRTALPPSPAAGLIGELWRQTPADRPRLRASATPV